MKELYTNIVNSFKNNRDGFSGRKLTAFSLIVCIYWVHYKYVNHDNATEVLIIDLCGVLISLGIVTAQNLIEFKNGKANTDTNTTQ